MRQPIRPNRKQPEFRRCPVCEVEFWVSHRNRRWCSVDCRAQRLVKAEPDPPFQKTKRQIAEKVRPL